MRESARCPPPCPSGSLTAGTLSPTRCWSMLAAAASCQDLLAIRVQSAELFHCPAEALDAKLFTGGLPLTAVTGRRMSSEASGSSVSVGEIVVVHDECWARPRGCGLWLVLDNCHSLTREFFVREIAANTDAVTNGSFARATKPSSSSAELLARTPSTAGDWKMGHEILQSDPVPGCRDYRYQGLT